MDFFPKLSRLSCIQNHDLSWIRNENATYVVCKQAVYLVKNNRVKKSRGDGEEKMEEGSSKMPFPPPFNLAMAAFKLI